MRQASNGRPVRASLVLSLYPAANEWQKEGRFMFRFFFCVGILLLLMAAACSPTIRGGATFSEIPRPAPAMDNAAWPGQKPDGSVLLPNQWSLRPVGRETVRGPGRPRQRLQHPPGLTNRPFAATGQSARDRGETATVLCSPVPLESRRDKTTRRHPRF